ncbi:MAG TPA: metallohydrolase [Ramlibacter sp.]|uniref:metallohydrolase n=1 Tax=Ramlibacter sp. TaxID=1917967 RepID=UPI002C967DB3|nr:metallohydrolase [Ramlibacter sp.]HVZ42520.1 metallohydrolase [Ramlibacter sp.]
MPASITFLPVDCGDMTLITLADSAGTTILIDTNIRGAADDPKDSTRDVARDLRERLKKDENGRPYVDVFLNSHPDADHIRGFQNHFHVGPLSAYSDDKKKDTEKRIVMREIWSSPIVYRRAERAKLPLSDDAKAFKTEAKRRVKVNQDKQFKGVGDGDRIQVMGEDKDGKTDKLGPILRKIDESFSTVNGRDVKGYFTALLLAPLPPSKNEDDEDLLAKNRSSVILNITLGSDANTADACKFLTAGDAEVEVWERLWRKHKGNKELLGYDLLLAPHHCSWHSLSHDSWSELREKAQVSKEARNALSQARSGASIVASSKAIKDDDKDPPCIRAKREYVGIVDAVKGQFHCTGEHPDEKAPAPLEFKISKNGPSAPAKKEAGSKAAGATSAASVAMPHGQK